MIKQHYWWVRHPPADSINPLLLPFFFPPSLSFLSPYRGAVCNVLLTCCKDSVCRLWAETLLPGDSLLSGHHNNHTAGQHSDTLRCAGSSRKNTCNGKMQGRTAQDVSCWNTSRYLIQLYFNFGGCSLQHCYIFVLYWVLFLVSSLPLLT